jgi:hypothetical protein
MVWLMSGLSEAVRVGPTTPETWAFALHGDLEAETVAEAGLSLCDRPQVA